MKVFRIFGRVPKRGYPRSWVLAIVLSYSLFIPGNLGWTQDAYGAPPKGMESAFNKILKKSTGIAKKVGISVVHLEGGDRWFGQGADVPLNLASNGKILSTAAAIRKFGAGHRYETLVYGKLNPEGEVEGDLFLVGNGDPKLMVEHLSLMAESLKKKGVRTISGGVVIDDSRFDMSFLPPAYEQKSTGASYRASVGALGVNYNAIAISFKPASKKGDAPSIGVSPRSAYALIDNRATTVKGKKDGLSVGVEAAGTRTRVRVDGKIGSRAKRGSVRRRIDDPGVFTGYLFLESLKKSGIRVGNSTVKRAVRPASLPEILNRASDSLLSLAKDTNEYSNNMMAETLFKTLGVTEKGASSWESSRKVVEEMLSRASIEKGTYTYLNGSGLYEADFLSASQMTQFLTWALGEKDWGETWKTTLPVGGKTGTLRGRMKGKTVIGKVRAKTGTLDQVVALSGYVETRTKGIVSFSFLFNDVKKGKSNIRAIRRIQDSLCEVLANL